MSGDIVVDDIDITIHIRVIDTQRHYIHIESLHIELLIIAGLRHYAIGGCCVDTLHSYGWLRRCYAGYAAPLLIRHYGHITCHTSLLMLHAGIYGYGAASYGAT